MNSPTDAWNELQREWQGLSTPVDAAQLRTRLERERRRMRWTRLAAGTLALVAVAGSGLALLHTPTLGDLARALPVAALIGVAWWIERQRWRSKAAALSNTTDSFIPVARERALLQLRAIRLAWLIVAAELAFLVPWWIDGYRFHADELLAPLTFITVWAPLIAVLAVLVWTVRVRRVIRTELKRLEQVAHEPQA